MAAGFIQVMPNGSRWWRLIAESVDPSAQRKAATATVQDTFEALV